MSSGAADEAEWVGLDRRKFPRLTIRCRARIHIGGRHYAGYLDNISRQGARVTTIAPIRDTGAVLLVLPDLQPLECTIQWVGSHEAGVEFHQELASTALSTWARGRQSLPWLRKKEAAQGLAA